MLVPGDAPVDRHGRVLAHLVLADGRWVQGALLASGWARVYSFADNRALIAEMLALEATARAADAGLWADWFFGIRDASRPDSIPVDRYELVEGVVTGVAEFDRRVYLNFGADWRKDFTVTISPKNARLFGKAGLRPETWSDREILVRGWINWRNGPIIEVTHPEQIEVLN